MSAARRPLAELNRITADLRDRTDKLVRQLRRLEADVYQRQGRP